MNKSQAPITDAIEQIYQLRIQLLCKRPILDAYLYQAKGKCGKRQCRCMTSDYRHHSWCLSYTEQGQSRTKTVPLELLTTIRQMTSNYRQVRQARKRLIKLCHSTVAMVDAQTRRELKAGRKLLKGFWAERKKPS